jgi:aarF domain-containing kinase
VASASIAQVHKARLHDGTYVAVKIQKPNIRRQFGYDMAMHHFILWVLEKAFDLPLLQFAEPIQRNLQKEVDFTIEADNTKLAEEGFRNLKRDDVCVPKIYDEFTKKRVLVT